MNPKVDRAFVGTVAILATLTALTLMLNASMPTPTSRGITTLNLAFGWATIWGMFVAFEAGIMIGLAILRKRWHLRDMSILPWIDYDD